MKRISIFVIMILMVTASAVVLLNDKNISEGQTTSSVVQTSGGGMILFEIDRGIHYLLKADEGNVYYLEDLWEPYRIIGLRMRYVGIVNSDEEPVIDDLPILDTYLIIPEDQIDVPPSRFFSEQISIPRGIYCQRQSVDM
jgi:hypothetical protein